MKSRRAKKRRLFFMIVFFSAIAALVYWSLVGIADRMLPSVLEITRHDSTVRINRAVNDALSSFTENNALSSADFYTQTFDDNNNLTALSVNTVLVNKLCAQLAVSVSEELAHAEIREVDIPLGVISGIDAFANLGPKYKVKLLPHGGATVNYESSFTAVGINQINFRIWLNVESEIRVVNPLQDSEFIVSRKIALVDTVFAGEIPKIITHPLLQ